MTEPQEYVDELIEMTLPELGLDATRRDEAWALAGPAGVELIVRRTADGAVVTAALADVSEASVECREAVGAFFERAQPALRLVAAKIDEHAASLESAAGGEELDVELARAVHAVARASRLLVHEARALMRPELAKAYLQHNVSVVSAGATAPAITIEGGTS
jgi:CO dehydrogenase nickel-insertion accessory protein CooC1